MEVWILNCLGLEGEIFSDYLTDLGYSTRAFKDRASMLTSGEPAVNPDVLIVGITAMDHQGPGKLIQLFQLEQLAGLLPGVPFIVVIPHRFAVPMECRASQTIHSFVHRPVPLEELETELHHLDNLKQPRNSP